MGPITVSPTATYPCHLTTSANSRMLPHTSRPFVSLLPPSGIISILPHASQTFVSLPHLGNTFRQLPYLSQYLMPLPALANLLPKSFFTQCYVSKCTLYFCLLKRATSVAYSISGLCLSCFTFATVSQFVACFRFATDLVSSLFPCSVIHHHFRLVIFSSVASISYLRYRLAHSVYMSLVLFVTR